MVREFGAAAEVAGIEECTPPSPRSGEVLIRMTLANINPSDLVTISGAYASRTALPFVPGFEGVGVVAETGPGVSDLAVGDRVLPLGDAGAWQERRLTPDRWCFPVLPGLTDTQAATSYINPVTALLMLRHHLPPGTPEVAVNAAASAIGRMLVRMLGRRGVRPVAVVRHRRGVEHLRDLDAEVVVGAVAGGRRFDLVLDAVGGREGEELLAALRPGGTFVHYGLLSGRPITTDAVARRPDVAFVQFRLRDRIHSAPRPDIEAVLREAQQLVVDGVARSAVAAVHPLADLTAALTAATAPGRSGKILIGFDGT